jgi:hypothetical protein
MLHKRLAISAVLLVLACGNRADPGDLLRIADGSRDGSELEADSGGKGGSGEVSAPPVQRCPPCLTNPDWSGPWACIESDGCGYGWCDGTQFGTNTTYCESTVAPGGWCLMTAIDYVCPAKFGVRSETTHRTYPADESACLPSSAGDQLCGGIRCGSGASVSEKTFAGAVRRRHPPRLRERSGSAATPFAAGGGT